LQKAIGIFHFRQHCIIVFFVNADNLKQEAFSSPLLGNVFAQLKARNDAGLDVSVSCIADLTAEEMSHIAGVCQRQDEPVSRQAFEDCVRTILAQHAASSVENEDDLLAYQNKLKERKGIKA
jgi:hypothetical protein